ncbi:MAG TPA: DUF4367 domain-containing protein [Bacillus sp. (in: firmicutes)]|uniref:DUF4367 domain-containing protein n=1 Tax=Bacillus litorisediminis TaxID=2922713 RepID=UPI001FAE2B0F|nr:DUF4367 domain-containing protein [Bacillus litorisediminis]HWO76537.1 DUF4367 domain-containing protein [Bacillus sp. (in: firmicutes)]
MNFLYRLIPLTLIFLFSDLFPAEAIKYNHDSITISEVQKRVNFPVLYPKKIPKDWTLEIKTYPSGKKDFTYFRLHFMDKNDEYLIVGIEQQKEHTNTSDLLSPQIEKVDINGNTGYFKHWAPSILRGEYPLGGILFWNQNGTFIRMDSFNITKKMMLEIARSMATFE